MAVPLEGFLSHINPNPKLSLNRGSMALSRHPCSSSFSPHRFEALVRSHSCRKISVVASFNSPKGLGPHFISFDPRMSKSRSFVSFAASQEDAHSEVEVEKKKSELEVGAEESQEEWEQTLKSFKEQAIKMQSMSQEAYELYSEKAMVILKEASKQLKIQAEKARKDLSVLAKEISEEGKKSLSTAAENSPEPVKDIVQTFASTSTDDLNDISKVQDFYLGIPYGALLCLGGFLTFMLTGSISAIRFGVILGGGLLALSVSSLRSWREGEPSAQTVKGQAAIASIIFLRELRLFFQRPSLPGSFMTLVSGAMVAFYCYRIILNGRQKGPNLDHGQDN